MKVITVTEENIKYVYGRLKKFFCNRNHTGFEAWHNFDCGFKSHISRYLYIEGKKTNVVRKYPSPLSIEYIPKGTVLGMDYDYIRIRFTTTHACCIDIGDKISFLGNRIIHKSKSLLSDRKYIYSVYQVLPMNEGEQFMLYRSAEFEYKLMESIENRFDIV